MNKLVALCVLFLAINAHADMSVTPIVGVERVQKFEPEEYTSNRIYYGVRFLAGPPLLSLEAELTQAKDDKTLNSSDVKIQEESTNAQLGVRSTFGEGPLNFFLRFGGSARKTEITKTTISTNVQTTEEPAIVVNPYAGTGLNINVANAFRINAGITAIFSGSPRGSEVDYQATLGYTINFSSGGRR